MPRAVTGSRTTILLSLPAAMWVVFIADVLTPGRIGHGIVPRTTYGLLGIVMAPFIHANLQHLVANTIPLLLLGAIVLLRGTSAFATVALASAGVAGLGTWLFGAAGAQHVGASGLVFGFFGYLLLRAFHDRRISSAVIALLIAALYGGALLAALVPVAGISWSGHVFGFVGGAVAARRPLGRR